MFTPIHRALGLEPGDLTLELIEKAIEAGLEETADFDMKRVVPNLKEDKSKQEIAKDIAAMANSGGGWIIYGVGEGASDIAGSIHPCEWTATEEQQMLNIAYTKIDPPVVGLEFNKISCGENSDKKLVLMHIPDSVDAPHFARAEKNNFSAPRRNGPHTKPMTYRDIERGFRERFQRGAEQEKTLQDYFEQAAEALNPEQGVFLAIAAVPVSPKISAGSVDRDKAIQHTTPRAYSYLMASQRGSCSKEEKIETEFNFIWSQGECVKGMRQWVVRSSAQAAAKYRKHLHDDGTLTGGYCLRRNVRGVQSTSEQYVAGEINHCNSFNVEKALIDFFSLLREHAQERSVSGGFRIRVGLVGDANSPIVLRNHDKFTWNLMLQSEPEPIKRFQPVSTFIDPLAPIEDILPPLRALALDIVNQGGIQNLQVIDGEES